MKAEDMMLPADDHPCVIEFQEDPERRANFYLVHCACHDANGWYVWKTGDAVIKCRGDYERSH